MKDNNEDSRRELFQVIEALHDLANLSLRASSISDKFTAQDIVNPKKMEMCLNCNLPVPNHKTKSLLLGDLSACFIIDDFISLCLNPVFQIQITFWLVFCFKSVNTLGACCWFGDKNKLTL